VVRARAALEANAVAIEAQLAALCDEVRGMRQAIVGFVRHPIGSALPAMLVPPGGMIRHLKKSAHES